MTSSSVPDTANPQRAYFLALVFGAAAAVAYMFCVQPAQTSLSRAKQELENLQQRQGAALRDIRGAQQFKARLEELERARKPYAEGLLTPVLESYAMGARARLDKTAEESGLRITDYVELPKRLLPLPKPQAPQLYARQPVRLTCRGSYAAIVSFVMRVEKVHPLVSLQAFSLKARQNPDEQDATLVLEWPVLGVNTATLPPVNGGRKK